MYAARVIVLQIIFVIVSIALLALTGLVIAHVWFSVPYVPSKSKVISEMIRFAALKPGQVVYDLGAGDGRVLFAAKRNCSMIDARAIEISPVMYTVGRILSSLKGFNIQWKRKSFYRCNFNDADVIFLYLLPDILKKLESKFDQELKDGTRVISHAFKFPNKKPVEEITLQCGKRKRTVHVYEW